MIKPNEKTAAAFLEFCKAEFEKDQKLKGFLFMCFELHVVDPEKFTIKRVAEFMRIEGIGPHITEVERIRLVNDTFDLFSFPDDTPTNPGRKAPAR